MTRENLRSSQGFTLVELTLSIAFLGVLVLLSSAIIVQTISIYNKGVAIKQINQAGRTLVEDINRISSSGFEVNLADNGRTGYLCVKGSNNDWRSYTWSSERVGEGTTATADPKQFTLDAQPVSLIRSNDGIDGASYCYLPTGADVSLTADPKITSLLTSQVRILSVDITTPDGTNQALKGLRKVAFWIGTYSAGTVEGMTPEYIPGTPSESPMWRCKAGNLGNFCAVSKFETIIYTPNVEGWES